jgi:hypothetical protein
LHNDITMASRFPHAVLLQFHTSPHIFKHNWRCKLLHRVDSSILGMESLLLAGRSQRLRRSSICALCRHQQYALRHKLPARKPQPWTTSVQTPHISLFSTPSRCLRSKSHSESQNDYTEPPQAYPLSGYYSDLLSTPLPHGYHAPTTRPTSSSSSSQPSPPPTPSSTTEPQSPADRMAIVFGSRLAGPNDRSARYNPNTMPPESTWKTVNGVPIPPRPLEPDNCCMSGCAHCVWDDYRDDMEEWAGRLTTAQAKARASSTMTNKDLRQAPRAEVDSASVSMDDDGGGSEANWSMPLAGAGEDDLFAGIPVGIREFMRTEKRLRQKHREEKVAR